MPADEAAGRLRSRAAVLPALIVALDEWARCRRIVKDDTGAKALSGLAQALDADPWRRRVREAVEAKGTKALEELAASAEVARQAPSTVCLLARALQNSGRGEPATELLDKALWKHPDDFWLHFKAGFASSRDARHATRSRFAITRPRWHCGLAARAYSSTSATP